MALDDSLDPLKLLLGKNELRIPGFLLIGRRELMPTDFYYFHVLKGKYVVFSTSVL